MKLRTYGLGLVLIAPWVGLAVVALHTKSEVAEKFARVTDASVTASEPSAVRWERLEGSDSAASSASMLARCSPFVQKVAALEREKEELGRDNENLLRLLDQARAGKPYEFDVSREEWRRLASESRVKYRVPCQTPTSSSWSLSPSLVDELALSPDDLGKIEAAFQRSNDRVWATVHRLCGEYFHREDAMDLIGTDGCIATIEKIRKLKEPTAVQDAQKVVAELKAGMRPMPKDVSTLPNLEQIYLALIGEGDAFEKDLEESLGPEDAERIWHAFPCSKSVQ